MGHPQWAGALTPERVCHPAKAIKSNTMTISLLAINATLVIIIGILVLYLRSFSSAYATEKGKNLATHEDIDKVVEQVHAVTKTQEAIKAEISAIVWGKQRRWELQQQVVLELLKPLCQHRAPRETHRSCQGRNG